MNARQARNLAALAALLTLIASQALALPPAQPDPSALLQVGEPVASIPTADEVRDFELLDEAHVMVSAGEEKRYLLTLDRHCFGLRYARHVGVTASDNTIWAGFDALTADGEACSIRAIHLVRPQIDSL
jgi:hypothetical protein